MTAVNVDNPNGFIPVGTISGSPWSGYVRAYHVAANAANIFMGDAVKLETAGDVDVATAGDSLLGVCVGALNQFPAKTNGKMDNFLSNSSPTLAPSYSSGIGIILVCVGVDVLYRVQEDGDTTPLTLAAIGANVDIIATAGSTASGRSNHEIDSDSLTTLTMQMRIVDFYDAPNNELASVDDVDTADWLVKINESHFNLINMAITTGGVGPDGI
jgi:hypothetical protein